MTLRDLLLLMVKDGGGRPITVQEMTDELRRQHPDMTTKKLRHLIHAKLADLIKKGILTHSRTGPGVVMANSQEEIPALQPESTTTPILATSSPTCDESAPPMIEPGSARPVVATSAVNNIPEFDHLLVKMVQKCKGSPVTAREMLEKLERQDYCTKTKNLRGLVHARVQVLIAKGIFTRSPDGPGVLMAKSSMDLVPFEAIPNSAKSSILDSLGDLVNV